MADAIGNDAWRRLPRYADYASHKLSRAGDDVHLR